MAVKCLHMSLQLMPLAVLWPAEGNVLPALVKPLLQLKAEAEAAHVALFSS